MKRLPLCLGLLLVAVVSALLSHQLKGADGLAAAGAGIGLGILLVAGSYFLAKLSASLEGTKMLAAFYGSLRWSFGLVIAAVVVVKALYPELTASVVLPALGFYLVYRFESAIRSWGATSKADAIAGTPAGGIES